MRKVELRAMEQHKYNVIKNLVDKDGNKHRAAIKLGVTPVFRTNKYQMTMFSL